MPPCPASPAYPARDDDRPKECKPIGNLRPQLDPERGSAAAAAACCGSRYATAGTIFDEAEGDRARHRRPSRSPTAVARDQGEPVQV
ncbi:hypothetical protein ColLi_04913 [Colletotrichum liriopes]|uniref:Uncharacterized protein n=1 Tax=Colletotrichum liriopes TaxID=708192 RepID=A0AA37LQY5_9PEZI|nr:hypothetical protein ColLi_04913 [Colletotrichum liriopes]